MAPVLLMFGLALAPAPEASLLLNLEGVVRTSITVTDTREGAVEPPYTAPHAPRISGQTMRPTTAAASTRMGSGIL